MEEVAVVTDSILSLSSHAGFECLDCHSGIAELPHDSPLPDVACGNCHGDETATYVRHGRGDVGTTADLPTCVSCHGSHDILASTNADSPTHPRHLPQTCGHCHEDVDLAKKHDIMLKKPVESYEASIHGRATAGGMPLAASCNDCHSSGGTAHRILPPGDPESSINHFRIPYTCGKCHTTIEADYWAGVHGKLTARGETDSPVCTHCHGEHGILPVHDPRARVSPTHVAEATCTPCHEAAFLNEKYGIPAGRLASFVDSYHGLKSKAGDTRVANCTSCHGGHKILPSADPQSSIYPENLSKTCGTCHPGISAELATAPIHESRAGIQVGTAGLVATLYTGLIVATIGGMVGYVALDFRKYYRLRQRGPQVRRMDANAVAQHWLLLVSFSVLALTGFALRFHDGWLVNMLFAWDGGYEVRGIIHRAAATAFLVGCVWHVLYLFTPPGRVFWSGMWPTLRDATELKDMVLFNLGRRRTKPRFGRFSFVEKAEYWALIWGTVIMTGTGLFLWFDNFAVHFVPKGFLNIMLVIHFYEAVLATLAIAVWHLYSTVFSPGVYPGNSSWLTGSMPEALYRHEHPEDPLVAASRSTEPVYDASGPHETRAATDSHAAPQLRTSPAVRGRGERGGERPSNGTTPGEGPID